MQTSQPTPKISICVPNLNTRPYLPERFESIFSQTFRDWELIVYDSYSDDGSWEYIQELAAKEPRMRISQGPREKPPVCWNPALRQARGEYIYIATSDDTMMPECLEKMVAALEANSDCGLCQCELEIIDEKSLPHPSERQWVHYTLGSYNPELVLKQNKRLAPHDGLLFPALFTIYTSITQLLIRRNVFERVGYFDGKWGGIGDFEWGMRASLVENCVYIPKKLATWRIHPLQVTQDVHTPVNRLKMIDMARTAFSRATSLAPEKLCNINIDDFIYFLERDLVSMEYQHSKGRLQKLKYLFENIRVFPRPILDLIWDRVRGEGWGFWNNANRYSRLGKLLKANQIPTPEFFAGSNFK